MGSDQDGCLKTIDASAGGLVWVRRRNGSWWPGQILGRDELPAKCLLPPRSGTPIKLLGREDGSMDWYNLEKSKRVKAFRCGEYDECIERAKASAVCSKEKPANAGKYVRREDAILHALELEKAHFSNRNQIILGMNNSMAKTNRCLITKSKDMHTLHKRPGYVGRKLRILDENCAQELSQSVLSFEQPNNPRASDIRYMLKRRWRTPNDSEDDATEGIKRMRDLQEIGSGMVSKRKPNISFDAEEFDELAFADNASLSESNIDNGFSSICHINGNKVSCSSLNKKRSHVVLSSENSRKKNRHRPQAKVSKGSRVIIPSYCHWGGGFAGWSSLMGERQNRLGALKSTAKKGECSVVADSSPNCSGTSCEEALFDDCEKTCNTVDGTRFHSEIKDSEISSMLEFIDDDCSDGLIDVPLLMEDNIGGDYPQMFESYGSRNLQLHVAHKQHNYCSQDRVISQFSEGLGGSGFTRPGNQVNHVRQRIDKRSSEWYPNGKKNLKYIRLSKNTNSESFGVRSDQSENSLKDKIQKHRLFVSSETKLGNNSCGESLNHGQFGKCELVSDVGDVPQAQASKFTKFSCMNNVGSSFGRELEAAWSTEAGNKLSSSLSYARDRGTSFTVDVPISVIPSRQSFANHQVDLPVFSKHQVPKSIRSMSMVSLLFDVELNVQANYQGPHIPLVSLMSKLSGKDIVGHRISVEVLQDGATAALVTRNGWCPPISNTDRSLKNRINIIGKSQPKDYTAQSHVNIRGKKADHTKVKSPLLKRKSSNNKKSGFSPRKIRRLSSISVDRKDKEEERKPKVEKVKGPAVSCVPLRLVFSRINEALSCSARPANVS